MIRNTFIIFLYLMVSFQLCAKEQDNAYLFVYNLYKNYVDDEKNELNFNYIDSAADIFAPDLLELIRLDQENAQGEAGYLDWDPLCDCQDTRGIIINSTLGIIKQFLTI